MGADELADHSATCAAGLGGIFGGEGAAQFVIKGEGLIALRHGLGKLRPSDSHRGLVQLGSWPGDTDKPGGLTLVH